MRQIRFTASGSSSVYGNFGPGDLLRCSDAEARHFVEEAACAKYMQAEKPAEKPAEQKPERKPNKGKAA